MKTWYFIFLIIFVSCSESRNNIEISSDQEIEIDNDSIAQGIQAKDVPDNFDIVGFQKSFDLDSLLNSEDIILDTLENYYIKLDYNNKLCGRNIHIMKDSYYNSSMTILYPDFINGAKIKFTPDFDNLKLEMRYSGDTDSTQSDILTIAPVVYLYAEDYYDPVTAKYTGKKEITWFIKAYRN